MLAVVVTAMNLPVVEKAERPVSVRRTQLLKAGCEESAFVLVTM